MRIQVVSAVQKPDVVRVANVPQRVDIAYYFFHKHAAPPAGYPLLIPGRGCFNGLPQWNPVNQYEPAPAPVRIFLRLFAPSMVL